MERTGQIGRGARLLLSGPAQVALWVIATLLAVNAAVLLLSPGSTPAWAQQPAAGGRGDTAGVFVVPGQIDRDAWGAYLIDTKAGSIVLYQYSPSTRKLKLLAARTFVYDRYLEDYNTDPKPADIAELVVRSKPIRPGQPEKSNPGPGEKGDDKASP